MELGIFGINNGTIPAKARLAFNGATANAGYDPVIVEIVLTRPISAKPPAVLDPAIDWLTVDRDAAQS
jgi:hypothetical protein